jgi:hypothetical protein
MSSDVEALVQRARCFNCGDEHARQALVIILLFEYAASRSGIPLTVDNTFITVDSTEITVDQTETI